MGSIKDKLNYLSGTKNAIKAAIEGGGVTVEPTTTFRQYADKINGHHAALQKGLDALTATISTVIKREKHTPMTVRETVFDGTKKGTVNLLNLSGAGELHFVGLHWGINNYDTPKNSVYGIVTIDNSFRFFIKIGGKVSKDSYEGHCGMYTSYDKPVFKSTRFDSHKGAYPFVFDFNTGSKDDRIELGFPFFYAELGHTCIDISESKALNTSHCMIGSSKPLLFEKSLKIDLVNNYTDYYNTVYKTELFCAYKLY